MKVYWSGAAVALLADIELRRRSRGEQSLDTVLGELQRCCLPARYRWSGRQLFRKLDSFLDAPLFMPLYRRYAHSSDYPNINPVLVDLGVAERRGRVRLDDDATHADIRRALF